MTRYIVPARFYDLPIGTTFMSGYGVFVKTSNSHALRVNSSIQNNVHYFSNRLVWIMEDN